MAPAASAGPAVSAPAAVEADPAKPAGSEDGGGGGDEDWAKKKRTGRRRPVSLSVSGTKNWGHPSPGGPALGGPAPHPSGAGGLGFGRDPAPLSARDDGGSGSGCTRPVKWPVWPTRE